MADELNKKRGGPFTPEARKRNQLRFLKAYRETANIKASCVVARISRQTFYDWRDSDESFRLQLVDAEEDANDTLEYAAYDRAVLGVESYVVSQGKIVYEEVPVLDDENKPKFDEDGYPIMRRGNPLIERKYSDSLLTVRLKARMPEKYKDKAQFEHTGKNGGPIENFQVHVFLPDDDEKEKG